MKPLVLLLAGAALALALTGCTPGDRADPAPNQPSPTAPAQTQAPSPLPTHKAPGPAFLTAAWAQDHLPEAYLEFQEEPTGYEVQVILATDRPVTDFQFLSLTPRDEGDQLGWEYEPLYTLDTFSPQLPLVVTTTFAGDLPGRGITYTDADGSARWYTLSLSGKDGSLLLEEFTP